jgi:hypothetical protein
MTSEDNPADFVKRLHQAWMSQVEGEDPKKLLSTVLTLSAKGRPVGGELLDKAFAGDADAEAVLCSEAADYLQRRESLPEPLADFVADMLLRKILEEPKSKRDYLNVARNVFAVHAIAKVRDRFGIPATRQKIKHVSPEGPSATTYVAAELSEKESTIQDVWEKRRRKYGVFDG